MITRHSNTLECTGKQHGFSLLEVLIAATVLSVGFSGLANLALQSLSAAGQSRAHSAAAALAGEMHAQMRLAPLSYSQSLAGWQQRSASTLPGGSGVVCLDATPHDGTAANNACSGTGPLVVKLFWQAPDPISGRYVLVVNP